jgi:hypothetical protein
MTTTFIHCCWLTKSGAGFVIRLRGLVLADKVCPSDTSSTHRLSLLSSENPSPLHEQDKHIGIPAVLQTRPEVLRYLIETLCDSITADSLIQSNLVKRDAKITAKQSALTTVTCTEIGFKRQKIVSRLEQNPA